MGHSQLQLAALVVGQVVPEGRLLGFQVGLVKQVGPRLGQGTQGRLGVPGGGTGQILAEGPVGRYLPQAPLHLVGHLVRIEATLHRLLEKPGGAWLEPVRHPRPEHGGPVLFRLAPGCVAGAKRQRSHTLTLLRNLSDLLSDPQPRAATET